MSETYERNPSTSKYIILTHRIKRVIFGAKHVKDDVWAEGCFKKFSDLIERPHEYFLKDGTSVKGKVNKIRSQYFAPVVEYIIEKPNGSIETLYGTECGSSTGVSLDDVVNIQEITLQKAQIIPLQARS